MRTLAAQLAALAIGWLALGAGAAAAIPSDPPLSDARTVLDLLKAHPQDDLHVILIHGMRTSDRTTWDGLRKRLCEHLGGECAAKAPSARSTDTLVLAPTPPPADYLGGPVWGDDTDSHGVVLRTGQQKWEASQPFVDHYRFELKNGRRLIVDEINYWPLLFALKCPFIVANDALLAGPDSQNIGFCAAPIPERSFAWFTPGEKARLESIHPVGGRAPPLDAVIKNPILDWGITDAVLSVGTLTPWLRETIRCAFADVAGFDPNDFGAARQAHDALVDCQKISRAAAPGLAPPQTSFVIISHSLGAFLLMDTFLAAAGAAQDRGDKCGPAPSPSRSFTAAELAALSTSSRDNQSLCDILANSNYLYFFANQFPLIELARAQGMTADSDDRRPHPSALTLWAQGPSISHEPKQIVAFSDPGDVLTFQVPSLAGVKVFNAHPRTTIDWLWLLEWPPYAHVNYLKNGAVLKAVFGG